MRLSWEAWLLGRQIFPRGVARCNNALDCQLIRLRHSLRSDEGKRPQWEASKELEWSKSLSGKQHYVATAVPKGSEKPFTRTRWSISSLINPAVPFRWLRRHLELVPPNAREGDIICQFGIKCMCCASEAGGWSIFSFLGRVPGTSVRTCRKSCNCQERVGGWLGYSLDKKAFRKTSRGVVELTMSLTDLTRLSLDTINLPAKG
jgi:hypothetical protein